MPSALIFIALGAKVATSEYGSGMIRLTLTATPRRGRVLAAKAAVVTLVTLAVGLALNVGMVAVAQAIFASYGIESAGLGDGDLLRAVVLGGVLSPLFPVIALALGFMLRSTAAVVVAVFVLLFAPAFLAGLLPEWWSDNVLAFMPGPASDAVAISHLEGAATPISAGVGADRRAGLDRPLPGRGVGRARAPRRVATAPPCEAASLIGRARPPRDRPPRL